MTIVEMQLAPVAKNAAAIAKPAPLIAIKFH